MQLTPMMQQYQSFKKIYPDKLVLFRMGDFFETFGDDAKLCAKILNITLTARDKKADPTPLAGFPHHALEQYLPKIIKAGYCAVIVDQIEDPKMAKGIVKRAVTRIVTPGTLDSDNVVSVKNTYIGAFYLNKKELGAAFLDLSVGTLQYVNMKMSSDGFETLINSFLPAEALVLSGESSLTFDQIPVGLIDKGYGNEKYSTEILQEYYGVKGIEGFGFEKGDPSIIAVAMVLGYVKDTQKVKAQHIEVPKKVRLNDVMVLDRATISNLELVEGSSGDYSNSLFGVIDSTKTTMGRRLLYSWILNPLVSLKGIQSRLDTVDFFTKNLNVLDEFRVVLENVNDIERLLGKIGMNRSNARDLKALENSLNSVLKLLDIIPPDSFVLEGIRKEEVLDNLKSVIDLISKSIDDSPALSITEGHIIKLGYSPEVDEIRNLTSDSKGWLRDFETKERERTGISSLKISYNKVFGYYIEVTNTHKDKVPEDYIRKQTLVNNERYITEQLKEKESIILNAQERLGSLEYKVFQSIRDKLLGSINTLQEVAKEVAKVDVLSGFAYLANTRNYTKPILFDFGKEEGVLRVRGGRHPVVESLLEEEFVSNDTDMNMDSSRMIVLTGPNMSGKSTYIRQVAILVLLAQIGSYVPATSMELSLVDRIFTRVGASDDLSRGRSTFMVEMSEAANIVNNATKYSLVVLDEVGRGTSTYDGVSIAWALAEYLTKDVASRTLFATHYHELLKLSESFKNGIKNYNVLVEEDSENGTVIFLRKIVMGGTDRSYGIYVAKMAGLPDSVIVRANEILESFEQGSLFADGVTLRGDSIISKTEKAKVESLQIPLFQIEDSRLQKELEELDLDSITPIEALNILVKWKRKG